jgi:hypothetical protein
VTCLSTPRRGQLQHFYLESIGRRVSTDIMSAPGPPDDLSAVSNGLPNAAGSAPPPQSNAPAWSTQMSTFPANAAAGASPNFPQFSASTAAILERIQGRASGPSSGSAAFEAKRAEILQNYVTSDKLPTPPPVTNSGRRGRGGRVGTPSALRLIWARVGSRTWARARKRRTRWQGRQAEAGGERRGRRR